jgi:hypothetical protein
MTFRVMCFEFLFVVRLVSEEIFAPEQHPLVNLESRLFLDGDGKGQMMTFCSSLLQFAPVGKD